MSSGGGNVYLGETARSAAGTSCLPPCMERPSIPDQSFCSAKGETGCETSLMTLCAQAGQSSGGRGVPNETLFLPPSPSPDCHGAERTDRHRFLDDKTHQFPVCKDHLFLLAPIIFIPFMVIATCSGARPRAGAEAQGVMVSVGDSADLV